MPHVRKRHRPAPPASVCSWRDLAIVAAAIGVLLLAARAEHAHAAVIDSGSAAPATDITPADPTPAAPPGTYQLRCWQYGRLLFEESGIRLAADASSPSLRIRGADRNRVPVYVTETRNATCLIRGSRPERPR